MKRAVLSQPIYPASAYREDYEALHKPERQTGVAVVAIVLCAAATMCVALSVAVWWLL